MPAPELSIATFEPVIVNYERRPDGKEVWDCMDDRPPHASDTVLAPYRYYQIPGGIYGMALDWVVARERRKTGSFTNTNQRVHNFAVVLRQELLAHDIDALLHDPCAAEEGAPEIALSTAVSAQNRDVFTGARLFNPDITSAQFEDSAEITGRLVNGHRISESLFAKHQLRAGSGEYEPVPSACLKAADHNAMGYVALWNPDKCFAVPEADELDTRAYAVAMGAVEHIHRALKDSFPARLEDFRAATAVRVATIREFYLLGPDDRPLPIVSDLPMAA